MSTAIQERLLIVEDDRDIRDMLAKTVDVSEWVYLESWTTTPLNYAKPQPKPEKAPTPQPAPRPQYKKERRNRPTEPTPDEE